MQRAEWKCRACGVQPAIELRGVGRKSLHLADSERRHPEAGEGLQDCRTAPGPRGYACEGEGRSWIRHRLPDAGDEIRGTVAVSHDRREGCELRRQGIEEKLQCELCGQDQRYGRGCGGR